MSMLELPHEILAYILSFIPTEELYPYFVVCKRLLAAVKDEPTWQRRCAIELGLQHLPELPSSWFQYYQDNVYRWDPSHATRNYTERKDLGAKGGRNVATEVHHSGPAKNFVIEGNTVCWNGSTSYVSARSKRSFYFGEQRIAFKIVHCKGGHVFGVGLVDQNWDCRLHEFVGTRQSWCWNRTAGSSHSVTGLASDSVRPHKDQLPGWEMGDTLIFLMNFNPDKKQDPFARTIRLYKNGEWHETIPMPSDVTHLWGVASLYNAGDTVSIVPYPDPLPPGVPPSS
ncbi:hypothetical protein QOT17_011534 [Balamuthia mandrillaris]